MTTWNGGPVMIESMRRFPVIRATLTLEENLKCSRCPMVVAPFSTIYVVALTADRPNVGKCICENCFKKEMRQRTNVLRDDRACIKKG